MTFTLKPNAIFDFYEGEAPINFAGMNPKPLAIIFRASYQIIGGRTRRADVEVENYVAQCKAAGIKYGLYHFLTPNGIAEQAALFLSVWNKVGGANIAPIVDVEIDLQKNYQVPGAIIGQAVWQGHVKTFLDLIAAGTGRTPIIYTNVNYWQFVKTRNSLLQLVPPSWTADYPLWVAQYPDNPDSANAPAALPAGWTSWVMWQYNDRGRSNGFLANDLNIASAAFAAELGAVVTPLPVEPPADNPFVEATITQQDGTVTKFDLVKKA
jgi:GH25 family lysozyme M1 (1,4-beta-N-acetylmuramidase)